MGLNLTGGSGGVGHAADGGRQVPKQCSTDTCLQEHDVHGARYL
jgi:hypothetical protein